MNIEPYDPEDGNYSLWELKKKAGCHWSEAAAGELSQFMSN